MENNNIKNIIYIVGLLVIAVVCSLILAKCGSYPETKYITGKTKTDTVTKIEIQKIPFPVIKYLQRPETIITRIDTLDGRIDTLHSIDSVFRNVSIVSKTDTTVISEIATKYGPISDTTRITSIFRLPANTAEFTVKRSELNIEKVIQTIINSTTVTPVQKSSFFEEAGMVALGVAGGYLLGRVVR